MAYSIIRLAGGGAPVAPKFRNRQAAGFHFALLVCLAAVASVTSQEVLAGEAGARRIEEVIVTAERREASVQDTSISITAFTGEMLDDFGIRNQEDLQN